MPAAEVRISADYLRYVVESLEDFRSHQLGGRVAGTPEEQAAAEYIAAEMRSIGLVDVALEPVPVDAWHFEGASVIVDGGTPIDCASMAAAPQTPPGGVSGPLVPVGRGSRRELDRSSVAGALALVEWRDDRLWPYHVGLELGLRGAAGAIVWCPPGGPWFQAEGAIGTFDAMWHPEGPPVVLVRKEDGALLCEATGTHARLIVRAPFRQRGEATNVVGILPGRRVATPVLVGAHHDAWFAGAFDDATGVAATLGVARAFVDAGLRPQRPIAFISHTAEEYGIASSRFDWCYGAWHQIAVEHRGWASRAPFYLNIEGSGLPYPLRADPPPELAAWTRRLLRRAARDGVLPHGFYLSSPDTFTEVWPFLAAGVPGINVSSFAGPWYRTSYHTQLDTSGWVDFDYLSKLAEVYSRFLLEACAAPDAILDFPARASDLRRSLVGLPETPAKARLGRSLARLARARAREAFTSIARGLTGLDAHGRAAYPHEQSARDAAELEQALRALRKGKHRMAARQLAAVGMNGLCADLSHEAFRRERARTHGSSPRATWAVLGRLDPGPDLWDELASLRGEDGARPPGPWLERRLERELERARRELDRRLLRMAEAIEGKTVPLARGGYPPSGISGAGHARAPRAGR